MIKTCEKILSQYGNDSALECLNVTKNRDQNLVSREHIENCQNLIPSKNKEWVLNCIKSNVNETFANFCSRFTSPTQKYYKNAAFCAHLFDGVETQQIDMPHFNGGCVTNINFEDFSSVVNCVENAENKKMSQTGGAPIIRQRFNEQNQK